MDKELHYIKYGGGSGTTVIQHPMKSVKKLDSSVQFFDTALLSKKRHLIDYQQYNSFGTIFACIPIEKEKQSKK